jgi:O-antigen/teichoic acid export membrane protein
MSEEQSSYRKVMKATSIFGGVQIFTILISIIRSKFIALFLGTAGLGVIGLLNTSLGLIGGITSFGIGTSAVRDVSAANSTGDKSRISMIIIVLRRWVWITGILGTIIVLFFSPWLSQITFGNSNYIWSFILVSITLLFNQLNVGQLAVLQGMQKIKYLAKASLLGSTLGLIINVPIYYFYGVDGIVAALIIASASSFWISYYYAEKVKIEPLEISRATTFLEGKNMLRMGFMISLNGLLVSGTTYIIQIFINSTGGVEQVGLFTAGFAIINTYVGIIFTAMATDYFPRLSAVANSNELCKKAINQQAEISILILGPIIMVFLVFIKLIIIVLYSNKFAAIEEMVPWLALAIFFKAAAWSIGFILLAKGASSLFFWNDLFGNIYMLFLDILGYHLWGLTGLGISFFVGYLIYLTQVFLLSKKRYQFSFDLSFIRIFSIQFMLAVICFVVMKYEENSYSYIIGMALILMSVWYSYIELDKRLGLKMIINNFRKNRFNK